MDIRQMFPDHLVQMLSEQGKQLEAINKLYGPAMEHASRSFAAISAAKTFERAASQAALFGLDRRTLAATKAMDVVGVFGSAQKAFDALKPVITPSLMTTDLLRGFDQTVAAMAPQLALYNDIGTMFSRAVEASQWLRGLHLPSEQEQRKWREREARSGESLARAGWAFPRRMNPAEVVDLAEEKLAPRELDEWFERYYSADGGREFRALCSSLKRSKKLAPWRQLLLDAVWSHRRGRYSLVIPALLTVIEGLVCDVSGTAQDAREYVPKRWRDRVVRPPDGFILEVQWRTALAFLKMLWKGHAFDKPAPRALNRHWVLHGRRRELGARADALRLLAAVDFLADTAELSEKLARKTRKKRTAAA